MMKMDIKRVPLLPKSGKKDTLISDLLRSEPRFEKGTLFWEFSDTHVNIYRESGPPGLSQTGKNNYWLWMKTRDLHTNHTEIAILIFWWQIHR